MSEKLQAMFRCQKCNVDKIKVPVRERFANEDILTYTEHVAGEAKKVHEIISPYCTATVADIYLPMTQNGLGFAGPALTEADKKELDDHLRKTK
jgi:hypothetical protein